MPGRETGQRGRQGETRMFLLIPALGGASGRAVSHPWLQLPPDALGPWAQVVPPPPLSL